MYFIESNILFIIVCCIHTCYIHAIIINQNMYSVNEIMLNTNSAIFNKIRIVHLPGVRVPTIVKNSNKVSRNNVPG